MLALFQDRAIWDLPIVTSTIEERLMRRFAAAGTRKDLDRCARLLALAPGPEHAKRLMAGFEAAYAGRSLAGLPQALSDALARYSGQSVTLGLRQGKPEAIAEALGLLRDEQADRAKQLQYLQVLGEVRVPGAVPVLLRLACHSPDNALRAAALAALANYDDPTIAGEVLKTYGNLSDDVLAAAQNLLATRRGWAVEFLEAIDARTIDPRTVPREVVEKLAALRRPAIEGAHHAPLRHDPAVHLGRAPVADRTAGRASSGPAPAFPSRAGRSSSTSAPAATPSSARGARSGPT